MTQITRKEQVTILNMPYSLIIFRHSDNNSESLFEEEPTELYFKTITDAWAVFEKYYELCNPNRAPEDIDFELPTHMLITKYDVNGDGDTELEWDHTEPLLGRTCLKKCNPLVGTCLSNRKAVS